jgi:hypothetical protein
MSAGVMLDVHGTLLNANTAWVAALSEVDPARAAYFSNAVRGGRSRYELADELGVQFEQLLRRYRALLTPRRDVLALALSLTAAYPSVIVSNAPRSRLLPDLEVVSELRVCRVYSIEDGTKPQSEYLERILQHQRWRRAILIGNDPVEDRSAHPRVRSVIIPDGVVVDLTQPEWSRLAP